MCMLACLSETGGHSWEHSSSLKSLLTVGFSCSEGLCTAQAKLTAPVLDTNRDVLSQVWCHDVCGVMVQLCILKGTPVAKYFGLPTAPLEVDVCLQRLLVWGEYIGQTESYRI